jgi:hypothetical protein
MSTKQREMQQRNYVKWRDNIVYCLVPLQGWGWSFVIPGFLMIFLAALIFLGLVVQPSDVGVTSPDSRPGDDQVGEGVRGGLSEYKCEQGAGEGASAATRNGLGMPAAAEE